jgi:hypothetical protein
MIGPTNMVRMDVKSAPPLSLSLGVNPPSIFSSLLTNLQFGATQGKLRLDPKRGRSLNGEKFL